MTPVEASRITLEVNGAPTTVEVSARELLSDVLRDRLGLTGTHVGCEQGICGACTVLLDGEAVRSCLMFGIQAEGCRITTVEGLAGGGELTTLQEAFWEQHALQCAFCTSGLLMSGTELLTATRRPSTEEIVECVSGHLCRCTGYEGLVDAFKDAVASSGFDDD